MGSTASSLRRSVCHVDLENMAFPQLGVRIWSELSKANKFHFVLRSAFSSFPETVVL